MGQWSESEEDKAIRLWFGSNRSNSIAEASVQPAQGSLLMFITPGELSILKIIFGQLTQVDCV
jgi:predicted ATPase